MGQFQSAPTEDQIRVGTILYNAMEHTPVFHSQMGGIMPIAEIGPINAAVIVLGMSREQTGYVYVMLPNPLQGHNQGWVSLQHLRLRPVYRKAV